MRGNIDRIHFVGIGGIGMSGIAEVLLNLGYSITGSDLENSPIVERLRSLGATVAIGHDGANVEDAQVLVYSSAVTVDNPEVVAARNRKIPVIPRAEMLAELMRMKYSVAVSGSHGKTTTTSMAAALLTDAGLDPTIVIGGRLDSIDSNAKLGQGEYLVAEADESDRSFLKLLPTLAVVTNIDAEHLDTYENLADIQDAFIRFVNKVPFYGVGILCCDDPAVQAILPRLERRFTTYGFSAQANLQARSPAIKGFHSAFDVYWKEDKLGRAELRTPGRHHILNALATIAVGLELQIPVSKMLESLARFENADRRLQLIGEAGGVMVLDDYGHHPTEIIATLGTIKEAWNRRIVCVFQPHRYTRVEALMKEFWTSFNESDVLVVTDIYAAGEQPIEGVDAEQMAEGIKGYGHGDVLFIDNLADVPAYLMERLQPGDILVTLGAGDVWKIARKTLAMLEEEATGGSKTV
ncbi:MAG TPA: UDP-N-acetylmuramate--L-alanine ligase [Acidobacteriota bacterium]|nr:UDP-N-acetylmuramate--L-alanine ligase [Acidobacteriota bacterium]